MRRLALLLTLFASPVWAAPPKVAVLVQGCAATSTPDITMATIRPLQNVGVPYDLFYITLRTWGAAGVDDSVWFRQNYSAVIIAHNDGQAGCNPTTSTEWSTNFRDASAVTGIIQGPLSGRWAIPVFSLDQRVVPSLNYNDIAGNFYVAGIRHTGPAGSFNAPAASSWRHRFLCRLRGDEVDTVFTNQTNTHACLPVGIPAGLNGNVAALMWADTSESCLNADTCTVAWRYRPVAGKPGIYHFLVQSRAGSLGTFGDFPLLMLQYLFTITDVKPMRKLVVGVTEHDARVPDATYLHSVGYARLQDIETSAQTYLPTRRIATPTGTTEKGLYNATTLPIVRNQLAMSVRPKWLPFSYLPGNTHQFYAATDTPNVRQSFNSMIRTAISDTFLFLYPALNTEHIVSPAGLVSGWASKVLADGGCKVVETTQSTVQTASGWTLQCETGIAGAEGFHYIPGPSESRSIVAQVTTAIAHDTSLIAVTGNGATNPWAWLGGAIAGPLGDVLVRGHGSVYWHTGGATSGVTYADPYFNNVIRDFARQANYFNRVLTLSPAVQTRRVGWNWTPSR